MIFLNPRGGLCNRLRVIGSAIKLGMDYDDSIIVFWRKSPALGCLFEELFEGITYKSQKGKLTLKNVEYSEDMLIREIEGEVGKKRSYYDTIADTKKFQEDYIKAEGRGKFLLSTCYGFYDFFDEYDWLSLRKDILDKIEFITSLYGRHCIGIHIRRTDNEMAKRFSPNELFERIIDEEIKQNADVKFYLATDDMEVKKDFLDIFSPRIITSQCQTLARENRKGMISAVIDLYALARTQKIYGSYWSSFSQTAAAIGGIRVECVLKKPVKKLLNKKIVIYGAGQLGRVVYQTYFELCNIVGWVDQNYRAISDTICMEIQPPEVIRKIDFDYIVITVKEDNTKREILQLLLDMGVKPQMIVEEV